MTSTLDKMRLDVERAKRAAEISDDLGWAGAYATDVATLVTELERCRESLRGLTRQTSTVMGAMRETVVILRTLRQSSTGLAHPKAFALADEIERVLGEVDA